PSPPPKRPAGGRPSAANVSTAALDWLTKEQCAMNAIDRTLQRESRAAAHREARIERALDPQVRTRAAIELETRVSAPNYAPLPVVLTRGEGSYLWDTAGKRYV